MPKPADFFIGVVDLFSIFLPGALLSFLFLDSAQRDILNGTLLPEVEGPAASWIAFFLAAYLLGHLASLVGAAILDPIYDVTYVKYRRRSGDHLYRYVRTLKLDHWKEKHNITNEYKWARITVRLNMPASTPVIDRLEADSKFFRSVTIVLGVFAIVSVAKHAELWIAGGSAASMLLSFWRFADLRWKTTEAAYLALVVSGVAPRTQV